MVANIGLFMLVFRVLTASEVPTRDLRVGAVAAGVGWQVVQVAGDLLRHPHAAGPQEAYGVFGLVLGLIAWIYLLVAGHRARGRDQRRGRAAAVAARAADAVHR